MSKSTFEKNGGYFIDGVAYMDCKITGEPVANVSTEAKSVIGSKALMGRMSKLFPDVSKPKKQPTGRPAGWHFMNEFVDKDGTVSFDSEILTEEYYNEHLDAVKDNYNRALKRQTLEDSIVLNYLND